MKKLALSLLLCILCAFCSCSSNTCDYNSIFKVKIGTPTVSLSEVMKAQGFKRKGRNYNYYPTVDYVPFLNKEYYKDDFKVKFRDDNDTVSALVVTFRGINEFDRLTDYFKKIENDFQSKLDTTESFGNKELRSENIWFVKNSNNMYSKIILYKSHGINDYNGYTVVEFEKYKYKTRIFNKTDKTWFDANITIKPSENSEDYALFENEFFKTVKPGESIVLYSNNMYFSFLAYSKDRKFIANEKDINISNSTEISIGEDDLIKEY